MAQKIAKSLKSQCFNHEFNSLQIDNEVSTVLSIHDELTFGLTDTVTKLLEALLRKAKCSLNAINKIVMDSNLLDIFKEFKDDVERILQTDVKQCLQTEGLTSKLK